MNIRPLKKRKAAAGFSLVEAAIAVAIAGVGLTSTLGLLPKGVDTLRKAGETTNQSRISQQILSNLSLAQWQDASGADLLSTTYDGRHYYYDDMAAPIDGNSTGAASGPPAGAVYVAKVEIPPADLQLPQSGTTVAPEAFLRRVTIRLASATTSEAALADANPMLVTSVSSVITRSGR